MKQTFKKTRRIRWLFLIVTLSAIFSCTSYFTYKGQEVAEADRIEIKEGGPYTGSWDTRDLSLDYVYEQKKDSFTLSGKVTFNKHIIYNFRLLDYFDLRVHFVDGSGKIIEGKGIVSSGHHVEIENLPFKKQFALPSGAVAMVFSYSGRASELGDEAGRTDYEFWESPVRRRIF
ncbi:MAG TPA: hypothetical protein HPQ03_04505 [Deltaproteobacteria bacterium]|nr:hypothetical protein [Deltaproteobacteria bacterium]